MNNFGTKVVLIPRLPKYLADLFALYERVLLLKFSYLNSRYCCKILRKIQSVRCQELGTLEELKQLIKLERACL